VALTEHVEMLREDVVRWNQWRHRTRLARPDLKQADLAGVHLVGADLRGADLSHANLEGAIIGEADLAYAKLDAANFEHANLVRSNMANVSGSQANFTRAFMDSVNLTDARLVGCRFAGAALNQAIMIRANLERADLSGSFLTRALLVETDLTDAVLNESLVYGTAVWDTNLEGARQADLVISHPAGEFMVRADGLEVAQFLYLLLSNDSIRTAINSITAKVVLILGRFTPERKVILDGLRTAIRKRNYIPVQFDFATPDNRDLTETVSILAHMSRFIIADITDPRSIPQELMRIVPNLPSVPVKPLLLASQEEYGMFETFRRYPWVLEPFRYSDLQHLLEALDSEVIGPAESMAMTQTQSR